MNVSLDGYRGSDNAVKHETLFHNAAVLAAGELEVLDGIIVGINDHSGTYRTYGMLDNDPSFAETVLKALERAEVPVDPQLRRQLERKAGRDDQRK
jgi:hypothetical protein